MDKTKEFEQDFRIRQQTMALLKVFMIGLSQMTGTSVKALAGMATAIAEIAEETGGESLKACKQ